MLSLSSVVLTAIFLAPYLYNLTPYCPLLSCILKMSQKIYPTYPPFPSRKHSVITLNTKIRKVKATKPLTLIIVHDEVDGSELDLLNNQNIHNM